MKVLNHLQVCPVLGRNSTPHNAVRDVLSHLAVQNGVINARNAAVVETRLTAADGGTFDADVVYFDPSSRARVILEVSIVTIGSDTSLVEVHELD
jgi:S1-C subfamily serine protease